METKSILNKSSNLADESTLNTTKTDDILKKKNGALQKRYVLAIYSFFGFFCAYLLRLNLSVAIVDMANINSIINLDATTITTSITNANNQNHTLASTNNVSDSLTTSMIATNEAKRWSSSLQGYILSSFFIGYILTQMPAGFLTTRFGGRRFLGAGIGLCSLLSLLIPAAAYLSPTWLIFIRICQGILQGFMLPAMHRLWSNWAPPFERSRLATFPRTGSYLGSVFAMSIGGLIGRLVNWESIFYLFGIMGIIWSILWFRHIYETPSEHEYIDAEERDLIESYLLNKNSAASSSSSSNINNISNIPWGKIFCSPAVWAIVSAHFAENWGFYTMSTEMPTFFNQIMNYKIDKAGLVSSLPYLIMAVVLLASANVSDRLLGQKMTYTKVRKLFCCTGLFAQSIFMFLIIFSTNAWLVMILLMLAVGLGGMSWASFGVNHLDVGAHYANILMSISNTFATIPGILSPAITGHIIEHKSKSDWNIVFGISAGIYFFGALVYFIIGTGDLQTWAYAEITFDKQNDKVGITNLGATTGDLNTTDASTSADEKPLNKEFASSKTHKYDTIGEN